MCVCVCVCVSVCAVSIRIAMLKSLIAESMKGIEFLNFLSLFFYSVDDDVPQFPQGICSICIETTTTGPGPKKRKGIKLNCGHLFHTRCIEQWLAINQTCPYCRHMVNLGDVSFRPIEL